MNFNVFNVLQSDSDDEGTDVLKTDVLKTNLAEWVIIPWGNYSSKFDKTNCSFPKSLQKKVITNLSKMKKEKYESRIQQKKVLKDEIIRREQEHKALVEQRRIEEEQEHKAWLEQVRIYREQIREEHAENLRSRGILTRNDLTLGDFILKRK